MQNDAMSLDEKTAMRDQSQLIVDFWSEEVRRHKEKIDTIRDVQHGRISPSTPLEREVETIRKKVLTLHARGVLPEKIAETLHKPLTRLRKFNQFAELTHIECTEAFIGGNITEILEAGI